MNTDHSENSEKGALDLSINRRHLLKYAAFGASGVVVSGLPTPALGADAAGRPIIETAAGKVRGYTERGVATFKGIPYGGSTANDNRFIPPKKPVPWLGVRDAMEYGPMAMQPVFSRSQFDTSELGQMYEGAFQRGPGSMKISEDCLSLNIWSPGLKDGRSRPVLVWLHGGGFSGGSSAAPWADGTNLARKNDLVVVSINHRLNIFGHLYLGDIGGRKYADSGNVGMLDIVASLEWVRDNISVFGGDPDNVTIFGHSGGGSKVNVLMAMPLAQGLFHKAIQMSGPGLKMLSRKDAAMTTALFLDELGISRDQIDDIQKVPVEKLFQAMNAVLTAANLRLDGTWRDGTWYHIFDPVVDGRSLPRDPFYPAAPEISAHVPMLLGTAGEDSRADAGLATPLPVSFDALDETALYASLKGLGVENSHADLLIRAYRSTRPVTSPGDIFSAIASDLEYRMDAITMAERKVVQGKAPAYMYLFKWESPVLGGKYKSSHGFQIPFVFDNLEIATGLIGTDPDPRCYELAEKMARAWAAFARTGNPNHCSLPHWEPYSLKKRQTMTFDLSCQQVNDPMQEDRLAIKGFLNQQGRSR